MRQDDEVTRRCPRSVDERGMLDTLAGLGCSDLLATQQDARTGGSGGSLAAVARWEVRRHTTRPPSSAAEAAMSDGASS